MNIDNIKVGDKFSTETKLVRECGYPKANCNVLKSYINEIKCYLSYEKTGKINPKTHKISNEVIITDIFDTPKENTHTVKNNGKKPMYYPLLKNAIEPLSGIVSNSNIYCNTLGFDHNLLYLNYKDKDIDSGVFTYNYKLRNLLSNAVKSTCDQIKKRNIFYNYDKGIILWNDTEWEESKHFITKDSAENKKFEDLQFNSAEKIINDKELKIPLYHKKDKTRMEVYKLENYLVNYKFVDVYKDYNKELITEIKESFGYNKYCRGINFGGSAKSVDITHRHSAISNMNLWAEKKEFLDMMKDKMEKFIDEKGINNSSVMAHHNKMFKQQFTDLYEYIDYVDIKVEQEMKVTKKNKKKQQKWEDKHRPKKNVDYENPDNPFYNPFS